MENLKKVVKWVVIGAGSFFVFIIFVSLLMKGCGMLDDNKSTVKQSSTISEEVKEQQSQPQQKEYTFTPGNYVCGEDFAPGRYDVIAVDGFGNVICIEDDVNLLLGTKEFGERMKMKSMNTEFKNAKFKSGHTLEIKTLTVKLIRK